MKVTGMRHPLAGTRAWHETTAARAAAGQDRRESYRPLSAEPTTVLRQERVHRRAPVSARRSRQAVLLSLATSAALLGCSATPLAPWRLEPSYRIANGGGNTAQGYLALARQYDGEQRNALALDAYRRAAAAAPEDAEVQNTLGLALARQAQFTEAVTALRRAVALAPARAQLLNNLGYALLLDGHADEARAMFRLTLAVDPAHGMASRNLAHVDQVLGTPTAAGPAAPASPASPAAPPVSAAAVAAASPATVAVPPATSVAAAVVTPPATAVPAAEHMHAAAAAPAAVPAAMPVAMPVAAPVAIAAPVPLAGVRIEIVNGLGVRGAAARVGRWLREHGVAAGRLANLAPYTSAHTQVLYQPGMSAAAEEIARRMPMHSEVAQARVGTTRADVRILLGHDMRSHPTACATLGACAEAGRVAMAGDAVPAGTAAPR